MALFLVSLNTNRAGGETKPSPSLPPGGHGTWEWVTWNANSRHRACCRCRLTLIAAHRKTISTRKPLADAPAIGPWNAPAAGHPCARCGGLEIPSKARTHSRPLYRRVLGAPPSFATSYNVLHPRSVPRLYSSRPESWCTPNGCFYGNLGQQGRIDTKKKNYIY